MQELREQKISGERALFGSRDLTIRDSVFEDGESPLKESHGIRLYDSLFRWKYPMWYCDDVVMESCTLFEMARAGIWYTNNITVSRTTVQAPKNFRRCRNVTLDHVSFPDAKETLWNCENVRLKRVNAHGTYFAMGSRNIEIDDFELVGDYSFDGCENVTIDNARMLSKDAFWNSRNITVRNSFISGEYLGWNSHDLTLENCTIESLQGMCYIDNLVMKHCKLINTTLAFEYSTVDADITGKIDSVFNPASGTIRAESIDELIIQKDRIDPSKTKIVCRAAG